MNDDIVFLGWDVSTTGAGAVLLDSDGGITGAWCWQSPKELEGKDGLDERIWAIGQWAYAVIGPLSAPYTGTPSFLSPSIEAPFKQGPGLMLAMAQGAVICQYRGHWSHHAPQTVKATARQYRHPGLIWDGSKEAMFAAANQRWSYVDNLDLLMQAAESCGDERKALGDLVDAAWVAETDRLAVLASLEVQA